MANALSVALPGKFYRLLENIRWVLADAIEVSLVRRLRSSSTEKEHMLE
jgi:hypothetical protein